MAHQLSIFLDAATDTGTSPSYTTGSLVRGEVRFTPDADVHLNSIIVMLVWSITPTAISTPVADDHELEIVTRGLFGLRNQYSNLTKRDLRELTFETGDRRVVDQRNVSKESVPGFTDSLAAGSASSWRFTFHLPQEPWSYTGRLFRVHWSVEGKADIGRGPMRIIPFRHLPQTRTEFTLVSSRPQ